MTAEERARGLIAETELFDELGLAKLAAKSRLVAGDLLEALAMVASERSARRAAQERIARLEEICERGGYGAQAARGS